MAKSMTPYQPSAPRLQAIKPPAMISLDLAENTKKICVFMVQFKLNKD